MESSENDRQFIESQRKKVETMRDELLETLGIETEEFNQLFTDLATKDSAEIAKELEDHTALGMAETIDRERLRNISSALFKIEHGSYGECTSCGAPISQERLEAMPTASMCINCQKRREEERNS